MNCANTCGISGYVYQQAWKLTVHPLKAWISKMMDTFGQTDSGKRSLAKY
jgi:hypothetical protein